MSVGDSIEVDCRAVSAKIADNDAFLLLDCREADEHALVHIENSTLLPMSEIVERVGEIDEHREREVIVYCHHGMRSLQVATWLGQQGFANVRSMSGGIDRWAAEIDPEMARY